MCSTIRVDMRLVDRARGDSMATDSPQLASHFQSTRWSVIVRAKDASLSVKQEALDELLKQYLPPIRRYLRIKRRIKPDEIEDFVQGFVTSRIVEKDLVGRTDRERGKFRTFLLTALDRYLISEFRYKNAGKRSPGSIAAIQDVPEYASAQSEPSRLFEVEWARQVVRRGLMRMCRQCRALGRRDEWEIFKCRLLGPIYGRPKPAYRTIVEQFGLKSPAQVSKLLIRSKKRFDSSLRSVIKEYALDPEQIDEEINDLMRILVQASK